MRSTPLRQVLVQLGWPTVKMLGAPRVRCMRCLKLSLTPADMGTEGATQTSAGRSFDEVGGAACRFVLQPR
jgi:hypothetical protein